MPTDYDVILTARAVIDDYYLAGEVTRRRGLEYETRDRLRREIERKLPDGYTIDDLEGEYRTFRDERHMGQTIYELRVYL